MVSALHHNTIMWCISMVPVKSTSSSSTYSLLPKLSTKYSSVRSSSFKSTKLSMVLFNKSLTPLLSLLVTRLYTVR
ncbi:hypothetical protein E2C01_015746 [Portunus trituberculatus]|uniref:Uncharacterized protein n=1 Tax=Portunus trituberculatus TaxID=210409 RepID=A0A5B7DP77_PORTR|nr:hypothetical protein [Portunus trituberculatus]